MMTNLIIVGWIVLSVLVGVCLGVLFMWIRYSLSSVKKDFDQNIKELETNTDTNIGGVFTEIADVKKDLLRSIEDLETSTGATTQEAFTEIASVKKDLINLFETKMKDLDRNSNESITEVYRTIDNTSADANSYTDSKCDKLLERIKNEK